MNLKALHYKKTPYKQRHHLVRPFKPNFKYGEMRKFGFSVSRYLWKTCDNQLERDKGSQFFYLVQIILSFFYYSFNIEVVAPK
jgi:hypothetical protein